MMNKQEITELVDNYWHYVCSLLRAHDVHPSHIKIVEFHFKSAFLHGWKHSKEDSNEDT